MGAVTTSLQDVLSDFRVSSPEIDVEDTLSLDEVTLTVGLDGIKVLLLHLYHNSFCKFRMLVDICGVDYPERGQRFEVVYHLLSLEHNQRVRVRLMVSEGVAVPSVVDLYPNAAWYEREVWDMYGVAFEGHPDLRRILTDYGFSGHPQRKDFPLTGYTELRYDSGVGRVVYEDVQLTQDFRDFDFLSPWEGPARGEPSGGGGESP